MLRTPLVAALLAALVGVTSVDAQTITAPGLKSRAPFPTTPKASRRSWRPATKMPPSCPGYAHARDRMFQMDYLRRVASGTLAELAGPAALSSDVQLRTLGLRRAAWASYVESNTVLRSTIQAYTNGVNFWLRNATQLPVEYAALELTRIEPWSPVDTFVIGKLLMLQNGFDDDTGLTVRLGVSRLALLPVSMAPNCFSRICRGSNPLTVASRYPTS